MFFQIEEVSVKTEGGNEFKANIIEYGDDPKLWFLVNDGEKIDYWNTYSMIFSTLIIVSVASK